MNCDADLLDTVELYAEARGESYLLDLESSIELVEEENSQLVEIIAAAEAAGFKTIVFTS